MKGKWVLLCSVVIVLLLALAVGLAQAQDPGPPEGGVQPQGDVGIAAAVANSIPIQGRLTDRSGNPLNGNYSITASIYNVSSGGTALCSKTATVAVNNGLFNMTIDNCTSAHINGQQLYLGIKVGDDAEMSDRQAIYPVPYAMSLRPGAIISDSASNHILSLTNNGPASNKHALHAYSKSSNAVFAYTDSPHAAIAGENYGTSGDRIGVYGYSQSGIAIKAAGTGIIQSTARSYLWISGNALQKANSADTTLFVYDLYGGYQVKGGSDWINNKTVLVPVTIPGQLYGQNITVTGLDLYYRTSDDVTGIVVSAMRLQNGVGAGHLIFRDETDYVCPSPAQCVKHWDLTTNNILSDGRGIIYLAFQLSFASDTAYVQIGGVRLTLEHD